MKIRALFQKGVHFIVNRAATAGKASKAWALPRFWVSIRSYKKQPIKKNWGRILGLAWLKFAVASLPKAHVLHADLLCHFWLKKFDQIIFNLGRLKQSEQILLFNYRFAWYSGQPIWPNFRGCAFWTGSALLYLNSRQILNKL